MTSGNNNESATDRAIREALASVERIERERQERDGDIEFDPESADASPAGEAAPTADVSQAAASTTDASAAPKKTAQDVMIESLLKAKHEMQDVLTQTQKEAKDMFERLARVSADFENFKKRQSREKEDAIKFGNEKVFKELVPTLDNLHRALAAAGNDTGQLLDGVRLIAKQFEDALARFGVVGFSALGQPFDPARHEAVGSRPDATVPNQHVVEEYQRGYMLHERLLRPALVIVSTGAGG